MKYVCATIFFFFTVVSASPVYAQSKVRTDHDELMSWWHEARFGMFIHWGLYAIPAGTWNGKTGYGEWIRHSARIPLEVYDTFPKHFNPMKFDAEHWVKIAKDAGMKYIVITSKHHDGFCMFDSKQTTFNIMNTPFGRDVMNDLATACKKHGIRFCFYYSIMDWHHPDYLPRRDWERERTTTGADYDRYVEYMKAHLKELISQYGKLGVLWFDGEWENTWNEKRGKDLYYYVKDLQPDILINNRVGAGRLDMEGLTKEGMFGGDFGTPEQEIPVTGLPGVDWETCMTMNDHWGYNKEDKNFKSAKELIQMLTDIASKGGNYLLNVGPTAEGTFPQESIDRLTLIGQWMHINSEAIYGTSASPFRHLPWGRCTQKETKHGTRLYLHVFDWPINGEIVLDGILNEPVKAWLIADKKRTVTIQRKEDALILTCPGSIPDTMNTVIVLDIKAEPDITEPPEIVSDFDILIDTLRIRLETDRDNVRIYYTLDGSDPDTSANPYIQPVLIRESCVMRARCYRNNKPVSGIAEREFKKVFPLAPKAFPDMKPGVQYKYYEGEWDSLPDFKTLRHKKFGIMTDFLFYPRLQEERFAFVWAGFIKVPATDVYKFFTASDDGSKLFIDDKLIVENDGLHSLLERNGTVALREGYHKIRLEFFEKTGSDQCTVYIQTPSLKKQILPKAWLFHAEAK